MKQIVQAQGRRHLRARPALLPPCLGRGRQLPGEGRHPVGRPLWSDALDELLGPGARSGGAARGSPSRHRALGAGHLRERLLQSAGRAAPALRRRRRRAGGRLRLQLGGQRQGARALAVQAALCPVGRRRCRRRDRRGLRDLAQAGRRQRQAPLRHGSRLLGAVGDARPDRRVRSPSAAPTSTRRAAPSSASPTRRRCAGAPPRRSPTAR